MSLFKKNILEKLSDKVEAKIREKIGPVSTRHGGKFGDCGTAEEWISYEERAKTNCPKLVKLRDFIDDVESFFYRLKLRYYLDPKFYLKNIFEHPMWFVRAKTLKVGQWVDADTRILHINMQMLVDFIEGEKDGKPWEIEEYEKDLAEPEGEDAYGIDRSQYDDMLTAWEIYTWWKSYDNYEKEIDAIYASIPNGDPKKGVMYGFTSERLSSKTEFFDAINAKEAEREEMEQEMLFKLMTIRKSLWT
jgi:hypothetical protein